MKAGLILPSHVIFPQISLATNLVLPATVMSSENVQKLIDMFTQGAGLCHGGARYTTHTFCQGGAQHYFMFCKPGQRMSLSMVWWWEVGQLVRRYCALLGPPSSDSSITSFFLSQDDVLIRYLLNQMGLLEEDYSDALAPINMQYTESRAGKASLVTPGTVGEYQLRCQQQELALTAELGAMEQRLSTQIASKVGQALCHHPDPTGSGSAGV